MADSQNAHSPHSEDELAHLGQIGIDASLADKQAVNLPITGDPEDLLENDERILGIVHQHWIGLFGIYLMALAGAVALLVLGFVVLPDLNLSSEVLHMATFAAAIIVVLLIIITYVIVYVYEQSKLTLTDKSLVQWVQKGLFNKKISRLSMSNVEDVNVEQRGILPHLFNYGTLTVQTAGEEDNFVFSRCPNANLHAEQILEARQAYVRRQGRE
jgi:membrane protein YdbS with pleckstrin-like domain